MNQVRGKTSKELFVKTFKGPKSRKLHILDIVGEKVGENGLSLFVSIMNSNHGAAFGPALSLLARSCFN